MRHNYLALQNRCVVLLTPEIIGSNRAIGFIWAVGDERAFCVPRQPIFSDQLSALRRCPGTFIRCTPSDTLRPRQVRLARPDLRLSKRCSRPDVPGLYQDIHQCRRYVVEGHVAGLATKPEHRLAFKSPLCRSARDSTHLRSAGWAVGGTRAETPDTTRERERSIRGSGPRLRWRWQVPVGTRLLRAAQSSI